MTTNNTLPEKSILPLKPGIFALPSINNDSFVKGYIFNISQSDKGILIMIRDFGDKHSVPSNAAGTMNGWLLIKKKYHALVKLVRLCWMKKIPIIAYCAGLEDRLAVINRVTPLTKPET